MSYAGDPHEITSREDYKSLIAYAKDKGMEHTMSVMSITAGINLGPGTIALGYATID